MECALQKNPGGAVSWMERSIPKGQQFGETDKGLETRPTRVPGTLCMKTYSRVGVGSEGYHPGFAEDLPSEFYIIRNHRIYSYDAEEYTREQVVGLPSIGGPIKSATENRLIMTDAGTTRETYKSTSSAQATDHRYYS